MVEISDEELGMLDGFEGHPYVYKREPVTVLASVKKGADITKDATLESIEVLAYIKVDFEYKVDPNPAYLTACQITLNEQFPKCPEAQTLAINVIKNGKFTNLSPKWKMPSIE